MLDTALVQGENPQKVQNPKKLEHWSVGMTSSGLREGWAMKQGAINTSWKMRYIVLRQTRIHYFTAAVCTHKPSSTESSRTKRFTRAV